MATVKNYQRDNIKYANSADQTKKPQFSGKDVKNIMAKEEFKENFKNFITFFKLNYDIFASWYLQLDLFLYQKIVLHMMGKSNLAVIIASRGIELEVPFNSNIKLKNYVNL